jgi:hypothetical protein
VAVIQLPAESDTSVIVVNLVSPINHDHGTAGVIRARPQGSGGPGPGQGVGPSPARRGLRLSPAARPGQALR